MNKRNHLPQPLDEWLSAQLSELESKQLLRRLNSNQSGIDFASNDYLSLNSSGWLQQSLTEIVAGWQGVIGSTGSRLIQGHHSAFEAAEDELCRLTGHPSALFFNSGYAANIGAMSALFTARDTIFCDRLAHSSLLDGIRLSGAKRIYFKHNDLNDLETRLKKEASATRRGRSWIVTESVFSMDGDRAPLRELAEMAERYGAELYLDEAHAIGIIGPRGAGLAVAEGVRERIAVTIYPLGKAPGLTGAVVAGSSQLKDFLINRARSFIYSTALPPVLAELVSQTLKFLAGAEAEAARKNVATLADDLRKRLSQNGFDSGRSSAQIVPVIVGSTERCLELAERCRKSGLIVSAIRPPTVPREMSRLRITLQAARTEDEIEKLVGALR